MPWLSKFDKNLSDWLPENFFLYLYMHNMATSEIKSVTSLLIITIVQILN